MDRFGPWRGYGGEEEMPLGGYAVLLAAWFSLYGAAGARLARRRALPRLGLFDLALAGAATHKLTRIATKDWVTAPLRAPFTTYHGSAGRGEVHERSRGSGLRRAIGDLLTCNYCSGPWVAGALLAGWGTAPRATRAFASLFAVVAASDFLHEAYAGVLARRRADSAVQEARHALAEAAHDHRGGP